MTASDDPQLPSPSEPFDAWQRASAALRAAEARGATHDEVVRLSEQVIRARNALTLDRTNAGWNPPDDVLRHLLGDELLLTQSDDSRPVVRPTSPSSAPRDASPTPRRP